MKMKRNVVTIVLVVLSLMCLISCKKTDSYTVTFKQDGKEDIVYQVNKGESLDVSKIPAIDEIEGYDVRWSTNDFENISENITVTVVKTGKVYEISYNLDGGHLADNAMNMSFVTYGTEYELYPAIKSGYVFVGWKYGDNVIDSTGVWNIASDVNLTATYKNNVQTVTFKQDGFPDIVKNVNYGEDLTDIPTPQAVEGYDVVWNITADELKNVTDDIVVYAAKTPKTYTITYDLGECKNSPYVVFENSPTTAHNQDRLTLVSPTCEGYMFMGWKLSDGTVISTQEWVFAYNENVTLSAQWKDIYSEGFYG